MIRGVGVDVVEIARIERAFDRFGGRFLARVYGNREQEYSLTRSDPARHLAARFAAKEAVMKVLGTGWARGVRWRDIELIRASGEAPRLVLSGGALTLSREQGISRWHVSVSHSGGMAVAFVIGEGEGDCVGRASPGHARGECV